MLNEMIAYIHFCLLFICNIFKCKIKSCLRDSLHFYGKNIDLELILHNISCGVKRIPPNVQTNISIVATSTYIEMQNFVSDYF